ncbi:MAG: tyrosine-type recombinase/integrase [Burkholderiales bacterium]
MRHSYASFLVGAGASDAVLRELLGHVSTQMTRRYAHLRQEHLEQAVQKAF